jgi:hypothetical protein
LLVYGSSVEESLSHLLHVSKYFVDNKHYRHKKSSILRYHLQIKIGSFLAEVL